MTPEQMAALQRAHGVPDGRGVVGSCRARGGARASSTRSWRSVPVPPPRSSATTPRRCRCPASLPQGRRTRRRLDPGGVRADHGRAGAQRPAAGRADRHHLARRHGLDQPRRLGRRGARCSTAREHEDVFRAEQVVSPTPWRESTTGPASRARHRREQPVPQPRQPRPRPRAVRRPAAAGRHALRPVHRPRPRCAELCLLPGRALPAGGHAVGHHAGARRAAPTSRSARR